MKTCKILIIIFSITCLVSINLKAQLIQGQTTYEEQPKVGVAVAVAAAHDPADASNVLTPHLVDSYKFIWNDAGSGNAMDVSISDPNVPNGYFSFGSVVWFGGGNNTPQNTKTYVFKNARPFNGKPVIVPALDFYEFWSDDGTGSDRDAVAWRPICPKGYMSPNGIYATHSDDVKPDKNKCGCLLDYLAILKPIPPHHRVNIWNGERGKILGFGMASPVNIEAFPTGYSSHSFYPSTSRWGEVMVLSTDVAGSEVSKAYPVVINKATWSANGVVNDCTEQIRNAVYHSKNKIIANNETCGSDPAYGVQKKLTVEILYNGDEAKTKYFYENEEVKF